MDSTFPLLTTMIDRLVDRLERLLFGHRLATLVALALLTVVMGGFAAQLRMSAGFDKQLPQQHEYIRTFQQYRDQVFGANRVVVVVHAKSGDMWNAAFLRKLNDVTQAVMFLPGVDRRTVSCRDLNRDLGAGTGHSAAAFERISDLKLFLVRSVIRSMTGFMTRTVLCRMMIHTCVLARVLAPASG